MSATPSPSTTESGSNLIDLTAVVRAHQVMYVALLTLVQRPFDDQVLARVLQLRQNLVADLARAEQRMAART